MSKEQDLEYARWHVVSAALSYLGEATAYHRPPHRADWTADFGHALDEYVETATGKAPKRKDSGQRPDLRIIRASLLFALANWRPTEFKEWGPLPDIEAVQRELETALAAYVKSVTTPFAG